MKIFVKILLSLCMVLTHAPLFPGDSIQQWADDTQELWEPKGTVHDGSSTAISASMLGWGVGLAIVIGVVAAVLHQSEASSSSSGSH